MINRTILLKCVDARYDDDEKCLFLYCESDTLEGHRIITMSKSDFTYKGRTDFPDAEMHRTAALWKNKKFYISEISEGEK